MSPVQFLESLRSLDIPRGEGPHQILIGALG